MADLIAGADATLTPVEGYALGLGFLLHDLGMGASALVGGLTALRASPSWQDAAVVERRSFALNDNDPLTPEAIARIDEFVLRQTHAQHASLLGIQEWRDDDGQAYHIIDDADLRAAFGHLVGELAHSHWWPIEEVARIFENRQLGSPGSLPPPWTINRFRLAALLRCADAMHIDARRAPTFLRLIRGLRGYSRLHWVFQQRLNRPTLDEEFIRYSSSNGLAECDADAWWIAFDTINLINDEFSAVDNYLRDKPDIRFKARGVVGAHNAQLFASCLAPIGWKPIDARPHIEDVPAIIASLGGVQLYGQDINAPLRELLQNAVDATRAASAVDYHGEPILRIVTVTLHKDGIARLVVDDQGVGMSERGIVSGLLNFGNSFWRSPEFAAEYVGLRRESFRPAGRFGIGFFSVFILGDRVKVATRRFDVGAESALVLEFAEGLKQRPLLREARSGEPHRLGSGTSIEVVLTLAVFQEFQQSEYGSRSDSPFAARVARVARWALSPVNAVDGQELYPISPGKDLTEYKLDEFVKQCLAFAGNDSVSEKTAKFTKNIRDIVETNGVVTGRGAIVPAAFTRSTAGTVVDEAGMSLGTIAGFLGVCRGVPTRLSRENYSPIASSESVMRWAREQFEILCSAQRYSGWEECELSAELAGFGFYVRRFVICEIDGSYCTFEDLVEWAVDKDAIVIVTESDLDEVQRVDDELHLNPNVIVIKSQAAHVAGALLRQERRLEPIGTGSIRTLGDVVVSGLREVWPEAEVEPALGHRSVEVPVGSRIASGLPVTVSGAAVVWRDWSARVRSDMGII